MTERWRKHCTCRYWAISVTDHTNYSRHCWTCKGQKCCTPYREGLEHDTSITANPTSAGARHQQDLRVGTTQAVQQDTGTSNPD